jgi:hypothetical protein
MHSTFAEPFGGVRRPDREADLFFADLTGRSLRPRTREFPPASEAEEQVWSEAVAALPARYQLAYEYAQLAEEELDDETIEALTFDLLSVQDHVDWASSSRSLVAR